MDKFRRKGRKMRQMMMTVVFLMATAGSAIAQLAGNVDMSLWNSGQLSGDYTLSGNVNLIVNSGTVTMTGSFTSGAYRVTKTGAGTLILAGSSNGWTGGTTVSAGTLQLNSYSTATACDTLRIASGATAILNKASGTALNYS
ncbi:MAG: autotransporter-associated beta strand repeat-containing protein, partial [Bacteroidales bacterium]|nr:autotransporter-associated beta strand repeat-containing protein [Bacteroidales bacterium]